MQTVEAMQAPGNQQHGSENQAEFNGGKEHTGSGREFLCQETLHTASQNSAKQNKGFAL